MAVDARESRGRAVMGMIGAGITSRMTRRLTACGCAMLACALLAAVPLRAQEAQPAQPAPPAQEPAPAQAPAPVQPAAPFQPGFIDALGRWLGDSKAKLDERLKSTTDAAKGAVGSANKGAADAAKNAADAAKSAADAARQAAGSVVLLPGTRVVNGHERCPLAANGGADCAGGADALCRAKGYGSGRHLEVTSSERCRPRLRFANGPRIERNCSTETFVTRAVCQ